MLYFGYGSNMNADRMASRCPAATPIAKFTLAESKLVFRGVADCIYEPGSMCVGALWHITQDCEVRLDRYEGVDAEVYRKEYIDVEEPVKGYEGERHILLYVMNSTGIFPPRTEYANTIRQGYHDFEVDLKQLDDAIAHSWDNRSPTERERRRHWRAGDPNLAPHPYKKDHRERFESTTGKFRKLLPSELERQRRAWAANDTRTLPEPYNQRGDDVDDLFRDDETTIVQRGLSWDEWKARKAGGRNRVIRPEDEPSLFDEWHSPLN